MRFKIFLLITLLLFLPALSALAQDEEEEIQSEEEIWNTPKKTDKKNIKKRVEEEEEESPSGAFEYADDEDKEKEKLKKREEKNAKEDIKDEKKKLEPSPSETKGSQEEKKKEEEKKEGERKEQDITKLIVPERRLKEIDALWFDRLENIKKREFALADEKLKKIIEDKMDSGIPDIPPISLSITFEAKNALRANDYVTAQRLSEAALTISPDIYEIWFFNAYISWTTNKTELFKPLTQLIKALKLTLSQINTAPLVIGNILTLISLIISITAFLFIVTLLLKHANRILHDFSHLFPSGISTFISNIIWLSIFFIIIVRFLSIFHFTLFSCFFLWLYLKKKEKILLFLVVLSIAILPYNFNIYNRLLNVYRNDETTTYKALKLEDPIALEKLKHQIDSGMASVDDHITYGLISKRMGNFEIAEKMYKKAIEMNASNIIAYNNLANLYLITERYDDALIQYNNALNLEPKSEIVRYNISRLFLRKKELDKSNTELAEAKRFNEDLISYLLKNSTPSINRFIYDMEPSFDLNLVNLLKGEATSNKKLYLPFEHYITGGIVTSDVFFWMVIMIVVIIGVASLSRKITISHICQRCGKPVCKRCSPELHSDEECSQCFHIFTRRDVSDPKNRFLKDKEISSYQFLHDMTTKLLSIVIPGTIFIWKEKPVKGFIILLLSVSGFVSFFFFNRPNPLPYISTTNFELFFKSPFVIAGIITYLINIKNCFKRE